MDETIYINKMTGDATTESAIIRAAQEKRWKDLKRCPFGVRWIKMSQITLGEVSKMGLGKTEWSVFMFLLTTLHDGNRLFVNQEIIAKEIGNHQSHVCVALNKLIKRNLVEKDEGAPGSRFTVYHINPRVAWYGGDNKSHQIAYNSTPQFAVG